MAPISPTQSDRGDLGAGEGRAVSGLGESDKAEITNWKIHGEGGAGELLGINPNTLRNRMRKLGIPFKKNQS